MITVYWYCLGIGLIVLMLSLILDGISDLFQGLTFFDIHFDFLPGILPLSPLQICAFLVGFGGMGVGISSTVSIHLLLSIAMGFFLSLCTGQLLHKLRKVDSETLTATDIIGLEGKVIVTIFENGIGSVSLDTKVGKISYPARSSHYIKQGTLVKVLDMKDNVIFVSDESIYFLNTTS